MKVFEVALFMGLSYLVGTCQIMYGCSILHIYMICNYTIRKRGWVKDYL